MRWLSAQRNGPPVEGVLPTGALRLPLGREILSLVARGTTNRAAAAELFISGATVKTHLLHIYAKLGVNDRVAAVAAGYERGSLAIAVEGWAGSARACTAHHVADLSCGQARFRTLSRHALAPPAPTRWRLTFGRPPSCDQTPRIRSTQR
jgi:DNA-binding CsgD family transcriptional regulator